MVAIALRLMFTMALSNLGANMKAHVLIINRLIKDFYRLFASLWRPIRRDLTTSGAFVHCHGGKRSIFVVNLSRFLQLIDDFYDIFRPQMHWISRCWWWWRSFWWITGKIIWRREIFQIRICCFTRSNREYRPRFSRFPIIIHELY